MKDILGKRNRSVLEKFTGSNVLVGLDFDGTLAPIVADPDHARIRAETLSLLRELSVLYPCVVLSGRARPDLVDRLQGVPVRAVIGNHGAEHLETSRKLSEEVDRWRPVLKERLSTLSGVTIEDKSFSVSIHYRRAREKERARAAILQAAAALGDVRIIGGLEVVNILPPGSPHKGTALVAERDRLSCDRAIYVGDDDTDEDVFALDEPARLLGIRVGPSSESAARYSIASQAEIDELLRILLELRRETRAAVSR